MPRSVSKRAVPAVLLLPAIAGLLAYAPVALPQADLLWVSAMIQEADLILQEAAALQPAHDKIAQEGERMAEQEKALRAEVEAMQSSIKQFDAAMAEINAAVKKHQDECPQKIEDPSLAASCNAKAVALMAQARKLEEQGPQIEARRKDLNARVARHNAANQEFAKRRQQSDARDMLNQRDAEEWLGRAREFLASNTFNALPVSSGGVAACAPERIAELTTLPSTQGVKQAQACLRAVQPSFQ
jgi:cell division septum initiation protein DivIVA